MTYVDPQAPPPERVVRVRREGGATGWFVAGAVAIVAVVAIAFMLTVGARTPSDDQITQAQEQACKGHEDLTSSPPSSLLPPSFLLTARRQATTVVSSTWVEQGARQRQGRDF